MSDPMDAPPGDGLVGDGRYRMTHRLGRGGMAEVFAAEDVRLGRTVAVKLLRADLAEDPISKARFTREAQSVAGLNHHAVVAVYDSGEDVVGGLTVPYIVMELVEGSTIRDLLINAERPPAEQALTIVSGVLEALAYSHQHGIVHRDIKPANVIITETGSVKVMDFGIARALHGASTTMTQTGMVMGTPQYLSPEQALGKAVDYRSDLYATGCMLYELLTNRPPFIGETPLSVVYQHVQDIPVPPSEVADGVPPELDGLVMRALAKEPDDRFQSAEEMRGLIQYALQMLHEQGPFTGTWNTGPVGMYGAPSGGLGATGGMTSVLPGQGGYGQTGYGQTAYGQGAHSDTSQFQQSILPSGMGGRDDGSFDGYNGGRGDGGRGKMWLFAAFAVVAIALGVVLAVNSASKGTDTNKTDTSVSSPAESSEPETSPSTEPSETPTEEESTDTGNGNGEVYVPSTPVRSPIRNTPSATSSPSESPSDVATSPEESDPTTEEPTDTVSSDPATDSGGTTAGGGGTETGSAGGGTETGSASAGTVAGTTTGIGG